jgi:Fucose 4-O-acetylase and related acetyltransferases
MEQRRIKWVDVAKGIGIIAIILCHSPIPGNLLRFVLSFNVPLFFFLSGYTFKMKGTFYSFVRKRIRSLIVPYLLFSVIFYLFWFVIERRLLSGVSEVNPIKPLVGILYANNIDSYMIYDVVLWFIPCLFITEVLFYMLSKITVNSKRILIMLSLFVLIGFVDSHYMEFRLPWGIDIAFVAVVFYGTGYILKNFKYKMDNMKIWFKIMIIAASIAVAVIISHKNSFVYMYNNEYGNYVYFYIAAYGGITACIFIAIILSKSRILSYIGRNTLIILIMHPKVLMLLSFSFHRLFHLVIQNSFIFGALYTLLSIIIILPFIYIINRYFPFVLGKEKIKKN